MSYLRWLGLWALLSGVAFALLAWDRHAAIAQEWRRAQRAHDWRWPLAFNVSLFAVVVAAMLALKSGAVTGAIGPSQWFAAHSLLVFATALSLLSIDVPLQTMLGLLQRFRWTAVAALVAGLLVQLVAYLAQEEWQTLADTTLELTRAILGLYESDVVVGIAERSLQVGDFRVRIEDACSGYEGIGLVTAFLAIYLWIFRRSLRFPHAFALFPLGIGCVWLLNALRLALLTSIGAHLSPHIAMQGFHSQAGWVAFLLVTVATMVLGRRSTFFARPATQPSTSRIDAEIAYLAPFIALMLASMAIAAAAPNDRPLYGLKVIAVGAALWLCRHGYRDLAWRVSPAAVLAGLLVGAVWIATAPATEAGAVLGTWLAAQSASGMLVWLGLRVVGSALLVPIAEELAFRGFLYRWLVARRFEQVPFGHFSLLALVASSLLFGLMHDRWLAASLSGAIFALVMWRTKRLCDPITAHAVANGLICAWAIGFGEWSLL